MGLSPLFFSHFLASFFVLFGWTGIVLPEMKFRRLIIFKAAIPTPVFRPRRIHIRLSVRKRSFQLKNHRKNFLRFCFLLFFDFVFLLSKKPIAI